MSSGAPVEKKRKSEHKEKKAKKHKKSEKSKKTPEESPGALTAAEEVDMQPSPIAVVRKYFPVLSAR